MGDLPFSPFIYLFSNLFISGGTHGCLFILWVIIQRYFIYFVAQIVSALGTESSFSWFLCPFGILPLLGEGGLNTSLLPAITRFSRLIFYISCSSPTINHFFKKPRFLLLENGMRNQDLGTRSVHCSWDVISRPSQLTEQRNASANSNLCILTLINISI